MDKFVSTYLNMIIEAKFSNEKWKSSGLYKNIEIYESYTHLSDRLLQRYNIDLSNWMYWNIIKNQIIEYLINNLCFDKCSKKNPYIRNYWCHLTVSNMYVAFICQNDLDDNVNRVYFSTFLPNQNTKNKLGVETFDLAL